MVGSRRFSKIVVGLDGSEHAAWALLWAIDLAKIVRAEIAAVSALDAPVYVSEYGAPPLQFDPTWRADMQRAFEEEWCDPLRQAEIPYRTVMEDGRAAVVIAGVADRMDADLVVVGRRGRGGVAELLLGSVSHELTQHCRRPVLLISHGPEDEKEQSAGGH